MRKTLFATTALALAVLAQPASAAVNLVTNGDFEAGNTGFSSSYNYVTGSPAVLNSMYPEDTYTVGSNSAAYHDLWANVGPHGGQLYLIANGSSTNDDPVWQQTLNGLVVGNTYDFSAWAVNICCNSNFGGQNVSPLIISVGSGGSPFQIANTSALGTTGAWTQFAGSFVATSSSTTLSIFTDVTAASGNDYGLDDISVSAAVPEPATWAMMMFGFGVVGHSLRRRRNYQVAQAV